MKPLPAFFGHADPEKAGLLDALGGDVRDGRRGRLEEPDHRRLGGKERPARGDGSGFGGLGMRRERGEKGGAQGGDAVADHGAHMWSKWGSTTPLTSVAA
jgi:hypothetical protein